MSNVIISQLAIYPVKSLRQVIVHSAGIDMCGLQHDRRWMVVDVQGKMLTQRKMPRMCLIQPELKNGGLYLQTATMPPLVVSYPLKNTKRIVTVWKDSCGALDCGDEAAQWLSQFLQVECRLVYFPDDEVRSVDQDYARPGDRTAFSDGFPVLLTSQPSLDDLNNRITASNGPVPMARFRPNIVVDGCEPYAEDGWKVLKIGGLGLRIVKPCSRCVIPSIDIATGERGEEPTHTLLKYRKRGNNIYFGQNAIIDAVNDGGAEIKTGMAVEILE